MDKKLIGKKITKYRKKRDWTQRQLARQLSVSHQAVSKWEKGEAVPDLETLITMARIFGVSVDRLITPKSIRKAPLPPVPPSYEVGFEDKTELFELEENEHFEYDIELDIDEDEVENQEQDPKLKLLSQIAPFVSKEILDQKFLAYLEDNELNNFDYINRLAPFVSREVLSQAIERVINDEIDPKIVVQLAPFVDKNDLLRLVKKMKDNDWMLKNFAKLAPFLPKEYLNDLVSKLEF